MKYLVRDKVLAVGDDHLIEDEDGRHAFLVDGKALRVRDTLELKDPDGRILDREFKVEYDGELLALISRQWYRIRETYAVDVIREDADAALLIAVAVCVIRMAEKKREEDVEADV
ncbi:hypothetical protein [Streptomyces sp. NPDC060031]|uniref:hypothetical protein n=1 Tax=Streptomyces sp. NPDC060031 TaxID=3347043 RepID=UPI00368E47A5